MSTPEQNSIGENPGIKNCTQGCVPGYCLSWNAMYDESKCSYNGKMNKPKMHERGKDLTTIQSELEQAIKRIAELEAENKRLKEDVDALHNGLLANVKKHLKS
jgi:predicted nuclease with TOPRIM domain